MYFKNLCHCRCLPSKGSFLSLLIRKLRAKRSELPPADRSRFRNRGFWGLGIALAVCLGFPFPAHAQTFFPLRDVRPGLRGIGRTVFSGNKVENFQVEILGVLRDMGPRQSIVLARLSGGPLAETGIMQGMSGSPVYIDGKLLGAVALGFPFSKEPIAGIEPIEEMVADGSSASAVAERARGERTRTWASYRRLGLARGLASAAEPELDTPFGNLGSLVTPLALSGFSAAAVNTMAGSFRRLGFEPMAGLSGQGLRAASQAPPPSASAAAEIVPGSMISVGLLTGDMNITADGTVTLVDGKKVYAFGHRFLDIGSADIPFAHSDVVALIPNLNSSFKLSTPREWVGSITSDRATEISGVIGRSAHTVPLSVAVHSDVTGTHTYNFQVVNDRFLTPFITQTALLSVLDRTERALGRGTVQLTGEAEFEANLPSLQMRDTFVSDSGLLQQVSTDAVVPLAFVLGGGYRDVKLKRMSFHLEASESKRELHIAQAWTSSHDVRPGDPVEITALLQGENGLEMSRSIRYRIPAGASAGALNFTVSDGNTLNFPDFAGLSQSASRTAGELIRTINQFRDSDAVYVRVWRQQPSFTIAGPSPDGELNDPPPSAALILADPSDSATNNAALTLTRGSQLTELSIPARGYVVSGAKTLQVDVKE